MDPLSDVLRAVRLDAAFFYRVSAFAPWAAVSTGEREHRPYVLAGSAQLIAYHVLVTGTCWGGLYGDAPRRMRAGDVFVVPHGDLHWLSSEAASPAPDAINGVPDGDRMPFSISLGEPGRAEEATLVCGFLGCDRQPFNPLLTSLPRAMFVAGDSNGYIAAFTRQAVAEAEAPHGGSTLMLTRLAELMFLEVLRRHLGALSEDHTGWLAALRDPVAGAALAALHARPAEPWTLASLAREIAVSRSTLADRFTQLVGQPPIQYLAHWRMQLAAGMLANSGSKIAGVAEAVGYTSEEAFSRAFKKATGASPASWRHRKHLAAIPAIVEDKTQTASRM